jgi:hypothetical protein
MFIRHSFGIAIMAFVVWLAPSSTLVRAQEKAADIKALRCVFPINATGTWSKEGAPAASVKPNRLVLRFDAINTDEGTAELMNGTVGTGVTAQSAGGNVHFIQSFRSGPIYMTTVFDMDTTAGKLKAVHSRHEYFNVPLEGATSSPEQYYGECEKVN